MAAPMTWIEAPVRQKRPNTSLDVIPIHDVSNVHFTGFQYQVDPCVFPGEVPQDCYVTVGPDAGTEKTFGDSDVDLSTSVFGLYAGVECFLNGGIDDFEATAERILANGEYFGVDRQIAEVLATDAVPTTPATAGSIVEAIAVLEQTLAANVPGQGYIYLSPIAVTYAVANDLLVRNLDGTLETYLGTPVIVLSNPATISLTAFASGPINLWRGPIVSAQAPNVTANRGRALAERLYSLSIECGSWHISYTAPTSGGESPAEEMVITVGSIPSTPIPDGMSTTIIAQTTEDPDGDIILHFSINGGAEQTRVMTQTETLQFVYAAAGDQTTVGDSIELWATGAYNGVAAESNHITIEVIA